MLTRFRVVAAAAMLVVPTSLMSAPMFFFGEDAGAGGSLPVPNSAAAQTSFLSMITGAVVEDFEGFTPGETFPLNVMFGADIATLTGTSVVGNTGVQDSPIAGRFAISGDQYLNVGTTDAASFNLTFSSPQAAFGFFATDIGDFQGQLTIMLDGGPPITVPHTVGAPNGAALFWGVIDTDNPFTTVGFGNTAGTLADAFGFDDFTIGRREQISTPEPATLLILGMGLFALGMNRKRVD